MALIFVETQLQSLVVEGNRGKYGSVVLWYRMFELHSLMAPLDKILVFSILTSTISNANCAVVS